jgi:hypothetical protein
MDNSNASNNKVRDDKVKKSKKAGKGQDISKEISLSFRYEEFEHTASYYMPGVRKNSSRYYYDSVDILDQSQFRYILNLSDLHNNYSKYSYQTNSNIQWEDINTVIYYSTEVYTCPICLEKKLICPKITRCGHIFCWPCLLNYYEYWTKVSINKKIPNCPLCKEKISLHQIKLCEVIESANYNDISNSNVEQNTHFITFNLIMKDRKAPTLYNTFYDPDLYFYKNNVNKKDLFTFVPFENQSQFSFSRIFLTTPQLLQKRYTKVKNELQNALKDELSGYADEGRVESITKCMETIENKIKSLKDNNVDLVEDEEEQEEELEASESSNSKEKGNENQSTIDDDLKLQEDSKIDMKSFLYFYQENNGDIYYLHPINYTILLAEYEGEEQLPTEINVTALFNPLGKDTRDRDASSNPKYG